jgi:hypothetical protein
MDKPITVMRQEFVNALVGVVNNSGLPAYVMSPILESVTRKVIELEENQYQSDLKAWQDHEKEVEENGRKDI